MIALKPLARSAGPRAITAFLRTTERRLEGFDRAIARAEFRLYIGRPEKEESRWHLRRSEWLSDPFTRESVREARTHVRSPGLRRRLELLERALVEAQIEQHPPIVRIRTAALRRIARFRPKWKGRRVDRIVPENALRRSPRRRERRSAYYAEEPLHRTLEGTLRRLVELRNDRARALGFRSYPEYKLETEGLTVSRLNELIDSALAGAPARLRRIQERFRVRTGLSDWYPWDLDYLREVEGGLPEAAFPANRMMTDVLEGARGWGFRPAQLGFRVAWHDTPFGGLEIPVDPPRDVRIVATAQPGWLYRCVLFHEVGHAIHDRSTRVPTHLLRWHGFLPGFNSMCEGIGAVFEELSSSREWLASRRDLTPEEIDRHRALQSETELGRMVYHAEQIRAEIELYLHPERDSTPGRKRFLRTMLGYDDFRPLSVATAFSIGSPCYLPSYVLATLFAKQLLEAMFAEIGGPIWPNPQVGPWLIERWLRHGASHDWIPWVRTTTGSEFGPGAFRRATAPGSSKEG